MARSALAVSIAAAGLAVVAAFVLLDLRSASVATEDRDPGILTCEALAKASLPEGALYRRTGSRIGDRVVVVEFSITPTGGESIKQSKLCEFTIGFDGKFKVILPMTTPECRIVVDKLEELNASRVSGSKMPSRNEIEFYLRQAKECEIILANMFMDNIRYIQLLDELPWYPIMATETKMRP